MDQADENTVNWHLGQNEKEFKIIDFEFLFWRAYYSWIRWQEDCHKVICDEDLAAHELALLHVIRMKDRPKTIYDLGRLLNRDDIPNIQYNVKKLVDIGCVTKIDTGSGAKKNIAYQITKKGIDITEAFAQARKSIFLKLVDQYGMKEEQFEEATKFLATMKGIFEEASRMTFMLKKEKIKK